MKAISLLMNKTNVKFLVKILSCIFICMLFQQSVIAQKKKIDPVITWRMPAPIIYGTNLSSEQLNATANVDGSLKYTPGAGTLLDAGTHTLSTAFTPKDKSKYNNATASTILVVNKAAATLTLSNLGQSYDGSPKQVTVTTSPESLSGVTVTYNGSPTAPSAAGSYTVVASLSNQNYQASQATGTLVISKTISEATVTLSNLTQTYDGTLKNPTVTTSPSELAYSVTFNGSTTAPINVGNYSIAVNITDPGYTGSATGTLIISKATATLTLSNLSQSYDGSSKPVTVNTDPVNLSGVSVTYDGSPTAPSATGSYTVVASLVNQNYHASNTSGTLTINKTTIDKVNIVVLGSSTAAGTGASSYSNSWVGLLTTRLSNDYPGMITLTNLAVGGYTTYHILPTGTTRVSGRPAVDTNRNITAALDKDPQIIIINMPSNDVANGYTDTETLNNFATVVNTALTAGVKVLLTGTQPRSDIALSIRPRLQSQNQSLLSIYGSDCINIYDELTDLAAYTIKTQFSSGDNIHLNNSGHNYIYTQVLPQIKSWIDVSSSISKTSVSTATIDFDHTQEKLQLSTYPNPFTDIIYIKIKGLGKGKAIIELFDIRGLYISSLYEGELENEAEMGMIVPNKSLSKGVYILRIKIGNQSAYERLVLER